MVHYLKILCPSCRQEMRVSERGASGKRVRCPNCFKVLRARGKSQLRPSKRARKRVASVQEDDFVEDAFLEDDDETPVESDPFDDFLEEDAFEDDDVADDAFDEEEYGPPAQLPTVNRKPSGESQNPKKKKKKRKKKRAPLTDSLAGAFFMWVVCGSAGGAIGAGLWGMIAYSTGLESGYIAWLLGIFVGFGIKSAGGEQGGPLAGLTGVAIAIMSIFLGKFAAITLLIQSMAVDLTPPNVEDPTVMVGNVASQVLLEWQLNGEDVELLYYEDEFDASAMFIPHQDQFPPEIWAEAEARWNAMSSEDQQLAKDELLARFEMTQAAMGNTGFSMFAGFIGVFFTLGFMDLIWISLASFSAYRLSQGIFGE